MLRNSTNFYRQHEQYCRLHPAWGAQGSLIALAIKNWRQNAPTPGLLRRQQKNDSLPAMRG
jgi:hypothetical protein